MRKSKNRIPKGSLGSINNTKFYTSTVPASKSIANIENLLMKAGAKNINKKIEEGECSALIFLIDIENTTMVFKLPAKFKLIEKQLLNKVKRPNAATTNRIKKQARRTAWKLINVWLEIQISMVQLDQVEIGEVLLPYNYDPQTEKTVWQMIKDNDYLPLMEK